jgi:hypothetical protein
VQVAIGQTGGHGGDFYSFIFPDSSTIFTVVEEILFFLSNSFPGRPLLINSHPSPALPSVFIRKKNDTNHGINHNHQNTKQVIVIRLLVASNTGNSDGGNNNNDLVSVVVGRRQQVDKYCDTHLINTLLIGGPCCSAMMPSSIFCVPVGLACCDVERCAAHTSMRRIRPRTHDSFD